MNYKTRDQLEFWSLFLLSAVLTMVVLDARESSDEKCICEINEQTK